MLSLTVSYLACILVLTGAPVGAERPEYQQECVVWNNISHSLEQQRHPLRLNCTTNLQCTGFDCMGQYRNLIMRTSHVTLDTCFGVSIHPCHKPVDLSFYVELPDQNSTFQKTLRNSDIFQLPHASFEIQNGVEAAAFIKVDINSMTIGSRQFMKISLTLKIRVKVGFIETWPSRLQVPLLSERVVPVPPCDSRVVTPLHPPATCQPGFIQKQPKHPPAKGPGKGPGKSPGKASTTTPSDVHGSGWPCNVDTIDHCSQHEFCRKSTPNATAGVCCCMLNYEFLDGRCYAIGNATTVNIILDDAGKVQDDQKSSKNVIITASSCVVGVIVVAIVVLVVVLRVRRMRRERARYGQHERLVNEDDDPEVLEPEDVDPIEI